ncbi:MAG: L-threonylcarbamoyladenylate synthase [Patescibacteria group bacterium]
MQILKLDKNNQPQIIDQACQVLANGGIVIYPTETVYGVGVDATNFQAVEKLLAYKSRREGKPLSVAVTSQEMAEQYVILTEQAKKFYQRFLPGPYTIVSQGKNQVAPAVESEFGTLGIRIPDYPLITNLVKEFGKPITSTSANGSDKKRPYQIQDIFDNLSKKQKNLIDLVIDAGVLPPNEPSIVIDTTLSTPLEVRGQLSTQPADKKFLTKSEQETKNLAGKLLLKYWNQLKNQGLIIGLNGKLGTGKTIFTQGMAQFLQIDQPLSSPTYNYLNQYDFTRHNTKGILYHLDVWKIDSEPSFKLLNIPSLVAPNTVTVIEWWQQIEPYWPTNLPLTFQASISEVAGDIEAREIRIFES